MHVDQNLYEIKGLLKLLRGDPKHYFKQLGIVFVIVVILLGIIAFS